MLISFKFNYISYTIDKIDCFDLFTLKLLRINKSDSLIYMHTPIYYIIVTDFLVILYIIIILLFHNMQKNIK